MRRLAVRTALAAIGLASVSVVTAQQGDSAAVVRRLERYAELIRTGPVDSVAASFTADGRLMLPGMAVVSGRDAIYQFLAPMASSSTVESCSMTAEKVEVSGATAYEWGEYQQRAGPTGKPAQDYHGRFVAELKKDSGGHWLIARLLMQPG